jgi:arginyl-tRNA synthetase
MEDEPEAELPVHPSSFILHPFCQGGFMNLVETLQGCFRPALAGLTADPDKYLAMIRPAQDAKFGADYQANFAMALAKELGRKPPEVAAEAVKRLDAGAVLEPPSVAGPGFINLRFRTEWLTEQVRTVAADDRLGVVTVAKPRTFVIDYSSPNVAKPLHVGHIRSTIIGDALKRLLRFLGHTVIGDNHLGDWGTQFGILLYGYKNYLDAAAFERDPVRELARLYVCVRGLMKKADDEDEGQADDPVAEACRQETARLHAGDKENLALWQQFMPACLAMIQPIYDRLGVQFEHTHGESFYQPMLPGVVDDQLRLGIAFESDGAVVIPNAKGVVPRDEEEQKKEDPPGLIRKRDGAFTYTTSDLATIQYRMDHLHPDAMLYVVDARQALHFKTLFAQARRWGYDRVEMQHVSFGSIMGQDRKPLQTRKGGQVELMDLLDEAARRGGEKYEQSAAERRERGDEVPELSAGEKAEIAEAVGIGAVKYADLMQNRTSDYVFDWDKMLSTDGNSATYMQYAYARCRSIFRKGDIDAEAFRQKLPPVTLEHASERALALQLLRFEEALCAAAADYLPHLVTGYLWDLAKVFSGFFRDCPVLRSDVPPALKQSRLVLVDLTARTIRTALGLLGIRTVERL